MDKAILLFLKYPQPGRVKTRLAESVGDHEASLIYRGLVERLFATLRQSPADRLIVFFDPPGEADAVRRWLQPRWPTELRLHAQSAGDLGDRLRAGFQIAFSAGCAKAAAIGADCVDISADTFAQTWRHLEKNDIVFGPAQDGGYYLVAMNRPQPALFDVTWSSGSTLAESLGRAREAQQTYHLLATLSDIDTIEDWQAQQQRK